MPRLKPVASDKGTHCVIEYMVAAPLPWFSSRRSHVANVRSNINAGLDAALGASRHQGCFVPLYVPS